MFRMERASAAERAAMGRRSGEIIARFTPEGFGEAIARVAEARGKGARELIAEVMS